MAGAVQRDEESSSSVVAIIPCPDPMTGGIHADLKIIEQLRARGWAVDPVTLGTRRNVMPSYHWWNQLAFNVRLIRRFTRAAPGPTFLEDQGLSGGVLLFNWYARRFRRARIVLVTYHLVFNLWRNPVRRLVRRWIEGVVARNVDLVLASSENTKRELAELGVSSDRIRVISLGTALRSSGECIGERNHWDRQVRLLSVGTVEPRKGLQHLIRALARLGDLEWRLDVAGGLDSDHHTYLQQLAASLRLGDRITFLGRVDDEAVDELMCQAHIFVHPSLGEGFGIAVLEAMERGLPVVATSAGALPELVRNEETGLLVPPADPGALATALRRLMVDPELRVSLGQAAATSVRDRYSWEETGRQVEAALSSL